MTTVGTVSALHLHPIKACHRIEVATATVTPAGLAGDREWQVVDGETPVTQRQHPRLAVVEPEPIDGGLRLSAPGRPSIEVARPTVADTTASSLVGVRVEVGDAGDDAAAWLSAFLGTEVRLVARTAESELRLPDAIDLFGQPITFSDISPILVATAASHRWLADRASEPFGMERFRPNIVVDGTEPFAEDTWARFTVGPATLDQGWPTPRCAVPQVDQATGERGREPAVVLRAHRWCTDAPGIPDPLRPVIEGSALFGIGCSIGPDGAEISVGDPVVVTETRAPLLAPPAG